MANRFMVGDIEVTVVSDGEAVMVPTDYYPASTAEAWEAHRQFLNEDGKLVFPFTCFVIRSGGKTVLIDTGLGPMRADVYRGGDLMGELAAAGVSPDEIDTVFVTHLHADHIGTAALRVDGEMRITFPNATYRWTQAEQDYWTSPDLPPQQIARRDIFRAVAPRYEPADGGAQLAPGVQVYWMPGHTPGHVSVRISSRGSEAVITGDVMHHPAQCADLELRTRFDVDAAAARRMRREFLEKYKDGKVLVLGTHFASPTAGRILRDGVAFRFAC